MVILRSTALLLVTALTLTGCKHAPAPTTSAHGPAPAAPIALHPAPAVDPATAGAISGIVHFDGQPPARIPIDMSADPACNLPSLPYLTEQIIVTNQQLANVYVYIKSGAPGSGALRYTALPNAAPIRLDQKGCRYSPHVIAVQQGGSVTFTNSDAAVHNIHTMPGNASPGNPTIDISEPANSSPRTVAFATPEVMLPVRCNNHPWMSAFINVAPNPWFAVTGTDGTFTITGVPPGTYTLAAVHEKLGEQDIQVTVPAKSAAQASFTFAAK
jgi:plastocyanin